MCAATACFRAGTTFQDCCQNSRIRDHTRLRASRLNVRLIGVLFTSFDKWGRHNNCKGPLQARRGLVGVRVLGVGGAFVGLRRTQKIVLTIDGYHDVTFCLAPMATYRKNRMVSNPVGQSE
jgi:hypothetical protein